MKKIWLLLLIGFPIAFTNCNKDESEEDDLTFEIVGDYIGVYGSNSFGEINPYEITVKRIDNRHVSIQPKSGTEFGEFEFELERMNSSIIKSPADDNQLFSKSVIFRLGIPLGITVSIDPMGEAYTFVGEKQ